MRMMTTPPVIVKQQPFEPLYVQTVDGESSIPRRVFYEVCRAYRPYAPAVVATLNTLSHHFRLDHCDLCSDHKV